MRSACLMMLARCLCVVSSCACCRIASALPKMIVSADAISLIGSKEGKDTAAVARGKGSGTTAKRARLAKSPSPSARFPPALVPADLFFWFGVRFSLAFFMIAISLAWR